MHINKQWTLEQHGFGQCRSTDTWIFSVLSTTVLHNLRMVESTDPESWIGRNCRSGQPTTSYTQIFYCTEGQCSNVYLEYKGKLRN